MHDEAHDARDGFGKRSIAELKANSLGFDLYTLFAYRLMGFLDYLAGLIEPVKIHYLWRPQLGDVADEMVLETAINGRANCIVTFNTRHFEPGIKFGINVIRPDEAMRRIA
jgi:predicted nucleic acid-binding protein